MPQQTITIEVPDGYELTGEYRTPNDDDLVLVRNGAALLYKGGSNLIPRLILRKAWEWPEWLTAAWIAMDSNGHWYAYDAEPVIIQDRGHWMPPSREFHQAGIIEKAWAFNFQMPICSDWRQSKRRNPNLKTD